MEPSGKSNNDVEKVDSASSSTVPAGSDEQHELGSPAKSSEAGKEEDYNKEAESSMPGGVVQGSNAEKDKSEVPFVNSKCAKTSGSAEMNGVGGSAKDKNAAVENENVFASKASSDKDDDDVILIVEKYKGKLNGGEASDDSVSAVEKIEKLAMNVEQYIVASVNDIIEPPMKKDVAEAHSNADGPCATVVKEDGEVIEICTIGNPYVCGKDAEEDISSKKVLAEDKKNVTDSKGTTEVLASKSVVHGDKDEEQSLAEPKISPKNNKQDLKSDVSGDEQENVIFELPENTKSSATSAEGTVDKDAGCSPDTKQGTEIKNQNLGGTEEPKTGITVPKSVCKADEMKSRELRPEVTSVASMEEVGRSIELAAKPGIPNDGKVTVEEKLEGSESSSAVKQATEIVPNEERGEICKPSVSESTLCAESNILAEDTAIGKCTNEQVQERKSVFAETRLEESQEISEKVIESVNEVTRESSSKYSVWQISESSNSVERVEMEARKLKEGENAVAAGAVETSVGEEAQADVETKDSLEKAETIVENQKMPITPAVDETSKNAYDPKQNYFPNEGAAAPEPASEVTPAEGTVSHGKNVPLERLSYSPNNEIICKDTNRGQEAKAKEFISLEQEVLSHEKVVASREKTAESPENGIASLEKKVTSPKNEVASPNEKVVSPKKEVVSPGTEVVSPEKEVASPDMKVVSPEKEVVSIGKEVVSPEKEVLYPKKNVPSEEKVVSPVKKVVSPGKEVVPPEKVVVVPDKEVVVSSKEAFEDKVIVPSKIEVDSSKVAPVFSEKEKFVCLEKEPAPAELVPASADKKHSAPQDISPEQEGASSTKTVPVDSEAAPIAEEVVSADKKTDSAPQAIVSPEAEGVRSQTSVSDENEVMPSQKDVSSAKESVSSHKKEVFVSSNEGVFSSDKRVTSSETIIQVKEKVSASSERKFISSDQVSEIRESISASAKTTSVTRVAAAPKSSGHASRSGRLSRRRSPSKAARASRAEEGHDSGVDETTQSQNGDSTSASKGGRASPRKRQPRSVDPSPMKRLSGSTTASVERKKLPMNKVEVGKSASPNLKQVKSKIGSLNNTSYKPGGGNVKIESKKLDYSRASSRITAKNEEYKPRGGDKKIESQKLKWSAQSKIGSLENATHKPGGGARKIESQKLNFKDSAQSKVGSRENIKHKPGGGDVQSIKIQEQRLDFKEKASSKVGSLQNVTHRPGGGEKRIFDDKEYLRQRSNESRSPCKTPSSVPGSEYSASRPESPEGTNPVSQATSGVTSPQPDVTSPQLDVASPPPAVASPQPAVTSPPPAEA